MRFNRPANRVVFGRSIGDMPIVTQLLGYSESAVFTRSYQRWHQLPPRRHRQQG